MMIRSMVAKSRGGTRRKRVVDEDGSMQVCQCQVGSSKAV